MHIYAVARTFKHWDKLTRFLETPGAPLDNNGAYAGLGITNAMPRPGLCRVGVHPACGGSSAGFTNAA